ncbi:hypothetical protein ACU4GH_15835 [Bradyrhizobium betae]
MPYVYPLDEKSAALTFKKGRQGLRVSFTQTRGRSDQSAVFYTPNRIYANVPFPDGAADLVFDETRPYLGCIAPGALEATAEFFTKDMAAMGWRKLTPETASRWPNADLGGDRPERRARVLRPPRSRHDAYVPEAGDADADASRRRPHQCRDQGGAVCAAPRARS